MDERSPMTDGDVCRNTLDPIRPDLEFELKINLRRKR